MSIHPFGIHLRKVDEMRSDAATENLRASVSGSTSSGQSETAHTIRESERVKVCVCESSILTLDK